ncbi:MAG: hypothetical protein GX419_10050, partial [Bacteroidales bacterium]|nr:hypothetical protein [Bacteroidales bacterium]
MLLSPTIRTFIKTLLRKRGEIILGVGLFVFSQSLLATDYTSNKSGNWNDAAVWTPNGVPVAGDNVTISAGHTITLSDAQSCNNLIINGTLQIQSSDFTVNETTTVNGTLIDNNGSGTDRFNGVITVNPGAVWNTYAVNRSSRMQIWNNIINNTDTMRFAAARVYANMSINGTGVLSAYNLNFNSDGLTVTNKSNVLIKLTLNGSNTNSTWKNDIGSVLTYEGSQVLMNSSGTLIASDANNTVIYLGGDQQVKTPLGSAYYNLVISGSGTKTLQNNTIITNNLTINNTATLLCNQYQITGTTAGHMAMTGGTTLLIGNTTDITGNTFPSGFITSNISLDPTSTVIYQANASQNISNVPVYGNLATATSGSKIITGNTYVRGNVTIGSNTVLEFNNSNYNLSVEGNWIHNGVLNENYGTITFTGSNNQTITGNPNETFWNLTIDKSGGVVQPVNGNTNIFVTNDFRINSGTFETGANTLQVSGNSYIAGILSINDASGSANLQNTDLSGGTITGSTATGTAIIAGNLSMPNGNGTVGRVNLTVNGTATVDNGRTFNITSSTGNKIFSGKVTVETGAVWNNTGNAAVEFRNGLIHNGSGFVSGTGQYLFSQNNQSVEGNSPVSFDGDVKIDSDINLTNKNSGGGTGITINKSLNGTNLSSSFTNEGILTYQPNSNDMPMVIGNLWAFYNPNTVNYSRNGNQLIYSTQYHHLIISGSGTKTLGNDITVNGNLTIENPATLKTNNFSITLIGNWTNNNLLDGFQEDFGIVNFYGNNQQTISKTGTESFYDLDINNLQGINLSSGNISIANELTMQRGNIRTNGNTVILSRGTASSLDYTSGTIIGKFQRAVSQPGADYLFPVGTDASFNPAMFRFQNLTAGDLTLEFVNAVPGNDGLPLNEGIYSITDVFPEGYWKAQKGGAFASDNFNLWLKAGGFSSFGGIDTSVRILKRTTGSDWFLDGNHVNAAGDTCFRNNMTGISSSGTEFGLGKTCAIIITQPANPPAICEGSGTIEMEVKAFGWNLSYIWQENSGSGWNDLTDGGVYSGTHTNKLTITNPPATMNGYQYRVKVTGGCGSPVISNSVSIAVDKLITANAGTDQEVCGNTASLAANNPAPGTGTWSKITGSGNISFDNPSDPTTNASTDIYGVYTLRWTIQNGTCSSYDEVVIDFNEDPSGLSADIDQQLCGTLSATLNATPHSYQAGSDHSGSTRSWSQVDGPGTITFTDASDPKTTISANLYGAYTLRWTETNGTCSQEDEVEIWFDPKPSVLVHFDTILCNQSYTNIKFESNSSPRYYTRITWTVYDTSNAITGYSDSPLNGIPVSDSIHQQLVNTDTIVHSIIYVITPWTTYSDSGLHCQGDRDSIRIFVNPTPRLSVSVPDTILCDSSTLIITVNDLNGPVQGTKVYQLTTTNLGGVIGVTSSGEYPAGTDIVDQLINPTNQVQTV